VLGYVMTQLHNRVEECIGGYCWGYTYKQNVNSPSQLSCHASATACDWNAPLHSNGTPASASFTDAQIGTIYQILTEVDGTVAWLADYDPMHFEICVSAADLAPTAARLRGTDPAPPNPDTGGFLMSLTDAQQTELYEGVKWLRSQLAAGVAPGQVSVGSTIAATLGQSQGTQNKVVELSDSLSNNLLKPGTGKGQTSVGSTIAATLSTTQNVLNEVR
jgi:hypothetical protein